jgi:hypothetical protein
MGRGKGEGGWRGRVAWIWRLCWIDVILLFGNPMNARRAHRFLIIRVPHRINGRSALLQTATVFKYNERAIASARAKSINPLVYPITIIRGSKSNEEKAASTSLSLPRATPSASENVNIEKRAHLVGRSATAPLSLNDALLLT